MDDKRLQKEMFINLVGPPLIIFNEFIKSTLKRYKRSGKHDFAHENSHLARLSASSQTVKRVI